MTRKEWESLCDGCGRCCLNKFEDPDTKKIHYSDVACKLLDLKSCQCSDYPNRKKKVPDCLKLTPAVMPEMNCLPPTCAYRLLDEGKGLMWWHPLVSGSHKTVHTAGISVRGRAVSENGMTDAEMEERLVRWPMTRKARPRTAQ